MSQFPFVSAFVLLYLRCVLSRDCVLFWLITTARYIYLVLKNWLYCVTELYFVMYITCRSVDDIVIYIMPCVYHCGYMSYFVSYGCILAKWMCVCGAVYVCWIYVYVPSSPKWGHLVCKAGGCCGQWSLVTLFLYYSSWPKSAIISSSFI